MLVISACGETASDPNVLLRQSKQTVDAAKTVHFKLTSSNVHGTGVLITGGEGDMQRPAGFAGTLDVTLSGLSVGVQVVSEAGTFYVKVPTDTGFTVADPALYGFGDPGKLLSPDEGLSSLLLSCSSTKLENSDRFNNEELDEVSCSLPGSKVAVLLTSADASKPVSARFGIVRANTQLRRVVLTGPFFSKTVAGTFTVVLDSYGENVRVTAPPTAGGD